MPRYKMVVYSRPAQGREDEYNDWYQNVHLRELLALPGFVSAQRFRYARSLVEGEAFPYMSIYEIESDAIDAVLEGLKTTAEKGLLTMSDAIDLTQTSALVYEEFGAVVFAES